MKPKLHKKTALYIDSNKSFFYRSVRMQHIRDKLHAKLGSSRIFLTSGFFFSKNKETINLYSIIMPFDTFEISHSFGANAPFSIIFSKVFKT